jgi:hypothetical protein
LDEEDGDTSDDDIVPLDGDNVTLYSEGLFVGIVVISFVGVGTFTGE